LKMLLCPAPQKFNTFNTFNTFSLTREYPKLAHCEAPPAHSVARHATSGPTPISLRTGRGVGEGSFRVLA
jgi:hypothetical protein